MKTIMLLLLTCLLGVLGVQGYGQSLTTINSGDLANGEYITINNNFTSLYGNKVAYKGTYASGTTYGNNDLVLSSAVAYISIQAGNTGNAPAASPSYWTPLPQNTYTLTSAGIASALGYTPQNAATTPVAATVAPLIDGTAAVGTSPNFARQDHVHPTDTSRAPVTNGSNGQALTSNGAGGFGTPFSQPASVTGLRKGNGASADTVAVAGTDYGINPLTPNTVSNGTTDDTTAAQSALPSGFTEGNPFLAGTYITNAVGQSSIFKVGLSSTGPLTYSSASNFSGIGDATSFQFCGTANGQHWMQPNTTTYAWGSIQDGAKFRDFRVDPKAGCAYTPGYAFYLNNTFRSTFYDVHIHSGFNTGVYLDQTAASSSAAYNNTFYNLYVNHATAQSFFLNYTSATQSPNSTNLFAGDLRDGPGDANKTSGYGVINKGAQTFNMFGTTLQANLATTGAQIFAQGPTNLYGIYQEVPATTANGNANGFAPLIDIDMNPNIRATGGSGVYGDLQGIRQYTNYWVSSGNINGSGMASSLAFPPFVDYGNPHFVDIIQNASLAAGSTNFAAPLGTTNGTCTTTANPQALNGATGGVITYTGSAYSAAMSCGWVIPIATLQQYIGQHIYVGIWVTDGTGTPLANNAVAIAAYGAGMTQTPQSKTWRSHIKGDGAHSDQYLYVVDIPILNNATNNDVNVYMQLLYPNTGATLNILGSTAWTGGWEATPTYRPNTGGAITYASGVFTALRQPLVTPASSSATCTVGDMNHDASYIYVCTATNTWKRVALVAF